MMLHQAVEQRLIGGASHLLELDQSQVLQFSFDQCLVQQHRRGTSTVGQRVVPFVGHRR